MSIPKNHHYVTQSLSQNFMSNGVMFKCNKEDKIVRKVKSTRSLFSQDYLNSKIGKDGEIDHASVESELNKNFETNFPKYANVIIDAVNSIGKVVDFNLIDEAIEYVIGMALIGEARHPLRMKEAHDTILGSFKMIADLAIPDLKSEIYEHLNKVDPVNNKTPLDFNRVKNKIRARMGEAKLGVMVAPDDHYFILPDCSSAIERFPVEPDVIEGVTYINPAMVIGSVFIPINSKILVSATSRSILNGKLKEEPTTFHRLDDRLAKGFNKILYDKAYEEVACENKEFLENFLTTV